MVDERIRVAVVGAGIYGWVHMSAFAREPRTELVCVWSRTEERARAAAEKFNISCTTRLEDIVEDERIQIVSIATPDFTHAEPAVMMLDAGKNVFLEKPMATSVRDCE